MNLVSTEKRWFDLRWKERLTNFYAFYNSHFSQTLHLLTHRMKIVVSVFLTTEVLEVNVPIAIVYKINVENFLYKRFIVQSSFKKWNFLSKWERISWILLVGYHIERSYNSMKNVARTYHRRTVSQQQQVYQKFSS